jgi:plasmid stabilization system protein ParE
MDEQIFGALIAVCWMILCGLPIAWDYGRRRGCRDRAEYEQKLAAAARLIVALSQIGHTAADERDEARAAAVSAHRKLFALAERYRRLRKAVRDGTTWRMGDE